MYQTFADSEKKNLGIVVQTKATEFSGIYCVATKVWFEMCKRKIACDTKSRERIYC